MDGEIPKNDGEKTHAILSGLPNSLKDHAVVWSNDDKLAYQKLCDKLMNAELLVKKKPSGRSLLSRTGTVCRFRQKAKKT